MDSGAPPAPDYSAAAVAWTEGVLGRLASGAPHADAGESPPAPAALVTSFALDENDARVLAFVYGQARSLVAWRKVREISGRKELTVELIRAALGEAGVAALDGRRPLRTRSLVDLLASGAPGGAPEPQAKVELSPGMALRLGRAADSGASVIDSFGTLVTVVRAQAKPILHESLTIAVRDHIIGVEPHWVTMTGARPEDAAALAEALSFRGQRLVVLVDGRATGALAHETAWRLLAAVRRECDLEDAILVVDSAAAVRSVLRALSAPALPGTLPRAIVLVNLEPQTVRPPEGYAAHAVSFVFATAAPTVSPEASLDPIEAARRQAGVDAAAAMGRPRPLQTEIPQPAAARVDKVIAPAPEPRAPPPPAPLPPPEPVAEPAPLRQVAKPAAPPRPAAKPEPAARSDSAAPSQFPPPPVSRPPEPAPAKQFPPPPVSRPPEPAGAKPFPPPPAARPQFPPPPGKPFPPPPGTSVVPAADAVLATADATSPAPDPAPVAAAAPPTGEAPAGAEASTAIAATGDAPAGDAPAGDAPAEPTAPAEEAPDPTESLPYVFVSDEASLSEIVQILYRTPNPLQRAELLIRVSQGRKDVIVVKALRTFVAAAHPRVRAAAEEGLALLFGPNWGKPREITPPVQPPRSED